MNLKKLEPSFYNLINAFNKCKDFAFLSNLNLINFPDNSLMFCDGLEKEPNFFLEMASEAFFAKLFFVRSDLTQKENKELSIIQQ